MSNLFKPDRGKGLGVGRAFISIYININIYICWEFKQLILVLKRDFCLLTSIKPAADSNPNPKKSESSIGSLNPED